MKKKNTVLLIIGAVLLLLYLLSRKASESPKAKSPKYVWWYFGVRNWQGNETTNPYFVPSTAEPSRPGTYAEERIGDWVWRESITTTSQ